MRPAGLMVLVPKFREHLPLPVSATSENCVKHRSRTTLHFPKAFLLNKLLCACFPFAFGVMASTRLTREEMEAELATLRADNQRLTNSLFALQVAFFNGYYRSNGVMVCFDRDVLERLYFEGHYELEHPEKVSVSFTEEEWQRVRRVFNGHQELHDIKPCDTFKKFRDILFGTFGYPIVVYYKKSRNDEVVKFDVRLSARNTTVRDVYKALVKLSPTTFPRLVNGNAILPVFFEDIEDPIRRLRPVGNRHFALEAERSISHYEPLQVWFPS